MVRIRSARRATEVCGVKYILDRSDDSPSGQDALVCICNERARVQRNGTISVLVSFGIDDLGANLFGAITATRSPGTTPASIRAYAKFWTR